MTGAPGTDGRTIDDASVLPNTETPHGESEHGGIRTNSARSVTFSEPEASEHSRQTPNETQSTQTRPQALDTLPRFKDQANASPGEEQASLEAAAARSGWRRQVRAGRDEAGGPYFKDQVNRVVKPQQAAVANRQQVMPGAQAIPGRNSARRQASRPAAARSLRSVTATTSLTDGILQQHSRDRRLQVTHQEEDSPEADNDSLINAVLVSDDDIVEANPVTTVKDKRRRRRVWTGTAIVALVFGAAIVVGAFCGTGACTRSRSSSSIDNDLEPNTTLPSTFPPSVEPTFPPTLPPTDNGRGHSITTFINNVTLSGKAVNYSPGEEPSSPEERALQWLIEEDPLKLTADTASDQIRLQQRYALLTLWFQSPDDPWTESTGWLVGDECAWFGIRCTRQLIVSRIEIFGNNLHGRIPADLGLLTGLTHLYLETLVLVGTLPDSIVHWEKLEELSLYQNYLTGTVPNLLGHWADLKKFDVGENDLSGTLPTSNWPDLKTYFVYSNAFSGTLPQSIGLWTKLEKFSVWDNKLTGTIPDTVVNWSQTMKMIYFSANEFHGTVPLCNVSSNWTKLMADCAEVNCSCCTDCDY